MSRIPIVLVLATALACAHQEVKPPVTWPDPPDPPRIRFVQAFRHSDDLDRSGWAQLRQKVFGGSNDPTLSQPMGLAISRDGRRIYVADFALGTVLVADFDKHSMKPLVSDEPMGRPFNVALDADENVYVSDGIGAVIRVFSKSGDKLRTFGTGELERPTGIAIDQKNGLLYVADTASRKSTNHRVRVFDLSGKLLRDLGSGKGEQDGQWHFPTYIAVDPSNADVYVSDTMNFRIQVFDQGGKFVRKYGENGDAPGMFARLKGLAFDSHGNLYVVDGDHSNVQLFNKQFQALMFFGGYARKLEYFDIPSGIAIDPATNRIYVCNEYVSRINVYELIEQPDTAPAGKP